MYSAETINQLYETYKSFQQSNPLLGSMLTAELTFTLGDITSQLISDKKIDSKKLIYTAGLAPIYGAGIYGLIELGDLIGQYIWDNPLAKAVLGPDLFGNLFNTLFFVNNTLGEKKDYSLVDLTKHYVNCFSKDNLINLKENIKKNYLENIPKKEYLYSVIGTITIWNAFHYFNYSYIQDEMKTTTALGASLIWTSILSVWSLKGRKRIVKNNNDNV